MRKKKRKRKTKIHKFMSVAYECYFCRNYEYFCVKFMSVLVAYFLSVTEEKLLQILCLPKKKKSLIYYLSGARKVELS